RDYFRRSGIFQLLGPCLGTSMHCPEWDREPSGPSCSAATFPVTWDQTSDEGRRLRDFSVAAINPLAKYFLRSFFSSVVLGRGSRSAVPEGIGTIVRRKGLGKNWCPICTVGK